MKFFQSLSRPRIARRDERSGQRLRHWDVLEAEQQHGDGVKDVWKPSDPLFWKENLQRDEHEILFRHGTERPRSSTYDKFYPRKGHFACRACGLPLYSVRTKFDSGTGWPSFGGHVAGNVETRLDYSPLLGKRTELHCARCGGHLGHVFGDKHPVRYNPGKLHPERQCINGRSIYYVSDSLPADTKYTATAL